MRGFLAAPPDRTSEDGSPTNALFALTRALRKSLAFKTPDLAVAVLDAQSDTEGWSPLLVAQLARLEEVLRAHGVHVVTAVDAIQVVAAYVHAARGVGHDVVLVGSDKRLAQLVAPDVWWYDAYKDVRYTPELVAKRFEVEPAKVASWLALVGDDDTLGGVKGIGKKGATDLVRAFGSVEAALDRADEVQGRTGKALRASLEDARRELSRARLYAAPELPVPLTSLAFTPPQPSALNELYRALAFYSFLETDEAATLEVTICDTPAATARALGELSGAVVAVHVVCEDPTPVRGELVGLALAPGGGRAFYFPLAGAGEPLASDGPLVEWLADPARLKVGHEVKAVTVALARRGLRLAGVVGDSACASHLTDPAGLAPHDLPLVARRLLRRPVDEDEVVRGVGQQQKRWAELAVPVTAERAGVLGDLALALWRHLEPSVPRPLLDEYLELSETLVRMELAGLACDRDDLASAGRDFEATEEVLEREIYALAGKTFNLGSTKQLGSVLFEDLGLTIVKRTKTGWSTATEALERIEHEHPIVPLVIRWRLLRRLRDSWVTALSESIDSDGRVRSTFYPARSFSGRLVNVSPDLGRVPGRTEEMARIRHAFVAPPETVLLSVDYRQLGLYVLAHLTGDPALVEPLTEGRDMHVLTAAAVLELEPRAIGRRERQLGKVVNFATFAGQGASALALSLGISAQEAKDIVARFDRRYAVARSFQDGELRAARERGYVETLAGRRWLIGGLQSLDTQMLAYAERMARRATHEGSVADVTRRGLLRADQALRRAGLAATPLLQVHDEVLFEVPRVELDEVAHVAAAAMRGAFELRVPLRVSCKAGPNWAELSPLVLEADTPA